MILRLFNQYPDWSFLYSALLCFRADSLRSSRMHDCELVNAGSIRRAFLNIHRNSVLTRLVPRETAAVSAHVLCTPYNHAPVCLSLQFYSKPYTKGACVFSCNLPPALLAEWPGSLTCYCGLFISKRKERKNASNWSSRGHKHIGSLFTNEKHKRIISWRIW